MPPLAPELRRELDKAIVAARGLAESAARAALDRLGAESTDAPAALSQDQKDLRSALRERAKALGGGVRAAGYPLLVEEIAYEQWHRMLFARFLAENNLLFHPQGAPVSLADVKDLAAEEGERDPWLLAARYAAAMLPGIFRADDPANRVTFAPEDRSRLEAVVEGLQSAVFTSEDGLGWVYQFWQSQRKAEVNKKGDKIGGADLPAVTQLFTEHYMVRFLLENSLGAWWAGRHPKSPLLREWEYLRYRDDGTPAAGTFEGWPSTTAEITVMDPCCGSGHFLVAAADMLRKMRIEEEGLTPTQAASVVIADNLFGLELDPRCLQLAAFNLALDAWKVAGYQPLPIPNLACSGIAIKGQRADWHKLAGGDDRMRDALDRLYNLFQDAPELGSLIDPRAAAGDGLWSVDVDQLLARLDKALAKEKATDPAAAVFGEAAKGTAKAAQLLAGRYWLVATNPPFLGRALQGDRLRTFLERSLAGARQDMAVAFVDRSSTMLLASGASATVSPQNWLFLFSYSRFREKLLRNSAPVIIARLGVGAFAGITGHVVQPVLAVILDRAARHREVLMIDAAAPTSRGEKAGLLRSVGLLIDPDRFMRVPSFVFSFTPPPQGDLLETLADGLQGMSTADNDRYVRFCWESGQLDLRWERLQTPPHSTEPYAGRDHVLLWEQGKGSLADSAAAAIRGQTAWGRNGIAVATVGDLNATLGTGEPFVNSVTLILPKQERDLSAIWCYVSSERYVSDVRNINQKLAVANVTLVRVAFDLEHWQKVAAEKYPNGLPEPHSDDPTQWLFKGNIAGSEAPLQVAVARLLGYRWPDQEAHDLDELADADGLVPLPSVGGERAGAERLRELLARAYGNDWSSRLLDRLLTEAGSPGAALENWLRDDFFAQHTKLFHQRPFVWHISDGRKDGFSVLCQYHRLDRAKLEKLTYTLLGDWIERQKAAGDEPGAEARLNAALTLQDKLRLIVEGEQPHDIYVRWKSPAEQPIGWEPDLDDGVRLNIRPFVTANVLRAKVNVKWEKDRGKEPDGSERINDRHPTLAEKRAARAAAGKG